VLDIQRLTQSAAQVLCQVVRKIFVIKSQTPV
jgi:hypothetical protein